MFYQPEIIVYLWLLPVTLLIGIPFVLTVLREIIKAVKMQEKTTEENSIPAVGELAQA